MIEIKWFELTDGFLLESGMLVRDHQGTVLVVGDLESQQVRLTGGRLEVRSIGCGCCSCEYDLTHYAIGLSRSLSR